MGKKDRKKEAGPQVVARNRRARFDFHLELTVEAGLALQGTEVKSLRTGHVSLEQAFGRIVDGEAWLIDADIPEYLPGSWSNHDRRRRRKLLLHRREIDKLEGALEAGGKTLVPLEIYFNEKGIAKLKLAVGTGKKSHDKRQDLATKDARREIAKVMRRG